MSIIWQPLGLPEKSVTFLIILLLIGFPLYIYVLWKTRIRFAKTKTENEETIETNIKTEINFKTKYFTAFGIIGLFSILSVFFIVNNNFLQKLKLPNLVESDKIAVLNFDNNTGDQSLDLIGKMTADWLIHGITENRAGEVITSEVVNSYSHLLGAQASQNKKTTILSQFLKPNKVISGEFFLRDSTLVLQCSIKNSTGSETQFAFTPIECDVEDSLICIENLRQEVVGFLINKLENPYTLEETPPNFKAYEKFQDAKNYYDNPERYLALLNESIAIDSNYFEPKVLRVQHYYNEGEYRISDSLNKRISSNKLLSKRHQHLLNFCNALIAGKNDKVVRNFKYEYDISPKHLESNSTGMTLFLQFLNQPEKIEEIYDVIPMQEWIIENCVHCGYRYYVMGLAYNELNDYQNTIDLLVPVIDVMVNESINRDLIRTLITAYINSNQIEKLENLVTKLELTEDLTTMNDLNLFIGGEFLKTNKQATATTYFNNVIASEDDFQVNIAEAYYYNSDYDNAKKIYESLYKASPNSINTITKLAICYSKNGDSKKGETIIKKLDNLRTEYEYGKIDYGYAQYYAALDDNENAMSFLLKSIAKGNIYTPTTFQNDVHFNIIKELPEFNNILTFWH
ncbi:hypothetical protein A9Q87_08045 [Flavobacteriales bacterium 34_180_T64]|nr:hypothetical protein A9Q87_08045 [Flavobacteriales bacterium 34_180_T64]